MTWFHPFTITPLGDSALVVDFGDQISEALNDRVLRLYHSMMQHRHPAVIDLVPAYASLGVFYDISLVRRSGQTAFEVIAEWIEQLPFTEVPAQPTAVTEIPVCYHPDFGIDIVSVAMANALSTDEIIERHTSRTYRIFMNGFQPGFPYMGLVDEVIAFPRRETPRKRVRAGSVGIAGKQTGIYPVDSPGGWQIIGRTPVRIFNPGSENPVLLAAGQFVRFYPITPDEFTNYQAGSA
ncbi:MAG TPA: 5-oxoprolinase subunit PxpB [Flavisolibacter sp.]